jgi:Flp pilus assembly protein TadD
MAKPGYTGYGHGMRTFLLVIILGFFPLWGCAPGSQAEKGAGEGAKYGAVGGAVAGAVSALIFGGNPVQGAVAGGLTGAASGAAVGAMAGSAADKQAEQRAAQAGQETAQAKALREKIGDKNYTSLLMLAQCQHKNAIASADETIASTQDPKMKTYALMIQGLAAEESGDKALAASVYPKVIKEDPSRGSVDKLRADTLEGLIRVQAARRQHGLPPTCS